MNVTRRSALNFFVLMGLSCGAWAQELAGAPVYSIVNLKTISDTKVFYKEYVPGHLPSVKKYGGKFIVVAQEHQMIEGDKSYGTIVMHQWPSKAVFREWYESDEYRPWRKLRHSVSSADVVLVPGLAEADVAATPPGLGISIVDVRIEDPGVFFNEYVPGHMPSIKKFGGKFLSAGPEIEVIEGDWAPQTIVVHQFNSVAVWKEWYDSDDYLKWRDLRHAVSSADVVLTESIPISAKSEMSMP